MISKKTLLLIGIPLFVASSVVSYIYFSKQLGPLQSASAKYKAAISSGQIEVIDEGPKTAECPLNGKLYSEAQKGIWEDRRPLGVAIENHTNARPQSGLLSADIIYEAVAEGGITRFLAIYYCRDAKIIGPVRSARIYFVKLLQGYGKDPLYAHVGGANTPGPANALGEIRDLGWENYNDLNQFGVPFPYYYRDYERLPNRATEHTMYSSTFRLWEYANDKRKLSNVDKKGKPWNRGFRPWNFKNDAQITKRGTVKTIQFGFWEQFNGDYKVIWRYSKDTNSYVRLNGGFPHIDKNTGKQIESKNIVIVFARESSANDGYEGGHLLYDIVGKGDGLIFQDGKVSKIVWKKSKEEDQMTFSDSSGTEPLFVRGQIFVEILPLDNRVDY